VYGDRGGAVVDASTLPRPDSPAGRARLVTERRLLQAGWTFDARPRIARIAGIYGPGRTLREAIREGRYRVLEGADTWSNRIHVDDLVEGLVAVWRRGENGRVYDLVDDEPHPPEAFARLVAARCGLELLTLTLEEARATYGPDRLARKLGSKRVSNRRLREELGVELRYPTFREGLPAALAEEDAAEGR
jgi:nucleoside-diphosphate-sugar epimerase